MYRVSVFLSNYEIDRLLIIYNFTMYMKKVFLILYYV